MRYDSLKLQKAVRDSQGHVFYTDWDFGAGRCPLCAELVVSPIQRPLYFLIPDVAPLAAVGSVKRYLLIAPNTLTRIHLGFLVLSDSMVRAELYESPAVSANGTAVQPVNRDMTSSAVAELQAFANPAVTADGTRLFIATAAPQNPPYSDISPDNEFILNQNTRYEIKLTSVVKATTASVLMSWAEVK